MAKLDGIDNGFFFHFLGAGLNHHNAVGGPDHHDVHQAIPHLAVGGIHHELAVDQSHAHRADRSEERNVRERQSGGGGVDAAHIGIVIRVGREHKGNDLGLALEAFGKQRPHRPVDHAAGKNFALTGTAFTLDEAAGDASTGVCVLAIINREGKEIDALPRIGIGRRRGQHHVIAQTNHGRAMRLLG